MADTAQQSTNAQQPAPAQTTAVLPNQPATPPSDPNNPNPIPITPPSQPQNKPSKKPKIFFIISLLMLIIGIVSLVFSLLNMKKKPAESKGKEDKTTEASSSATPTQSNVPTPTTPASPTLSLNKGYEIKNTACFSLQVPTSSSTVDENSCLIKIFKPLEKYTYNLILEPEYNDYKNPQGMYDNYQKLVKDGGYVFKNEEKIKIGGLEAIKVYQESKSTKIPTKMILVFVSNAGKYKNRETAIFEFQISAVYNAASKSKTEEVLKTIIESLSWK